MVAFLELLSFVSQGLQRMFVTPVAIELKLNEMDLFFASPPHRQHGGPRAPWSSRKAWEGNGRWAELLRRCQTKGWVRLATKGLLKWGWKFPVINGLSVCPEQAACTSRLPRRLCWTLLVTGMAKQQMLGVNPRFLWVCKVGCSHSQILHKLSLCANHKECPNCQGVFQLLEIILALSAPLNPHLSSPEARRARYP